MARRSIARRLLFLVVVAALAGCAQVPVRGPVLAGPTAGAEGIDTVRIEAQHPEPGAEPADIASGFVDAMSTYQVGFELAKEFLTPVAQDSWDLQQVVIYDSFDLPVTDDGVVHFTAQRVGDIDEDGQYTAANPGSMIDIVLPMVEVGGEWRISIPPPGVLISTLARDNDFSPYLTYYPSPQSPKVLVPDLVWLPGTGLELPTLLAQALVNGPTSRLADSVDNSVDNAFPPDTEVEAVNLDPDGIVSVDLTGPIASASAADQQAMAAQLVYTLRYFPTAPSVSIRGVVLTVDGASLAIPGLPGVASLNTLGGWDPLRGKRTVTAYAFIEDRLVAIDPSDGEVLPLDGPLAIDADAARSVAVNREETLAATVSENGRSMSVSSIDESVAATPQSFSGIDLATPSWDRFGNLWVVDRLSPWKSALYLIDPAGVGQAAPIVAPALDGVRVISLRVAPDGVRVAVSVERPDRTTRLLLLRVVQTDTSITLVGSADPPALPGVDTVGEVAWVGETDIAVVATFADRSPQPAIVRVDFSAVTPEGETGVLALAGYEGQPLLVLGDDGAIHRRISAITWESDGPGTAVTYPG